MPRSGSHSQVHLSLQSCARCCVRTLNCREESRRQAPSTSPLTALSPNGANSGNSTALLSWLDVSTDTHPQQQQVHRRSSYSSSSIPWECRMCCLPSPWIFIQRFFSHLGEQLLFTYLVARLVWSFLQQRKQARLWKEMWGKSVNGTLWQARTGVLTGFQRDTA